MYKQIFNKSDGTPLLIESIVDLETGEDVFEYNKSDYTEEMPPSDLYEPIYYENNEWHGASKEEWESNLPPEIPYTPSNSQLQLAMTQMQLTKTVVQLQKSQKELANVVIDSAKKDEHIKMLEQQQASTLLEITKLKGEK